jgi:hypothetical protein
MMEKDEEELIIPPLQIIFPKSLEVIRSGMTNLNDDTLECEDKEQTEEVRDKIEDEVLPQLSVYTVDEIPAKSFVRRLADEEVYQNWKSNCLIMSAKVFGLTMFF